MSEPIWYVMGCQKGKDRTLAWVVAGPFPNHPLAIQTYQALMENAEEVEYTVVDIRFPSDIRTPGSEGEVRVSPTKPTPTDR